MQPTPSPKGRWAPRRKILLLVALLPVWLLAIEGAWRVWMRLEGRSYSTWETERDLRRMVSALRDRVPRPDLDPDATQVGGAAATRQLLHPFVGYWAERDAPEIAEALAWFARPESARSYDILILGGSVAASWGWRKGSRFEQILRQDERLRERPIRYHVMARGGHKQPQQATWLVYLLSLGFQPDAVISLDGFNEVAIGRENAQRGFHPVHPSWFETQDLLVDRSLDPERLDAVLAMRLNGLEAERLTERAIAWKLTWSAALGSLVRARVSRLRAAAVQSLQRYQDHVAREGAPDEPGSWGGPAFDDSTQAVLAACVRSWKEGTRSLQALCSARGIYFLHVLQPAVHDTGSKPLSPEEIATAKAPPSWEEGVRLGYPLLREASQELAGAGVNEFDASRVFADVEETLFYDPCHLFDHGYKRLSEALAPVFLERMPR